MWKAVVIIVVSLLIQGYILVSGYLTAAEQHARAQAQVTAQGLACHAIYDAALAGRARLTPRDEAYCATIGR